MYAAATLLALVASAVSMVKEVGAAAERTLHRH